MSKKEEHQLQNIECARCKKEFEAIVPVCEIVESQYLSCIVWVHTELQSCPFCGQAYQFKIHNVKAFSNIWVPIKEKEESRILPVSNMPSNLLKP